MRRIVLVTRKFWPQISDEARHTADLSVELRRRECEPTIVTPRWEATWPERISYRGVPVERIEQHRFGGWGAFRHMRALSRWLRERRDEIDAIVVSGLRHDAFAAVGSLANSTVPVVLRAWNSGTEGDGHWLTTSRTARRIQRRCFQADGVIATCPQVHSAVCELGFDSQRVYSINDGVSVPPTSQSRAETRETLAAAHPVLSVPSNAPLVVYAGRLKASRGLKELVQAWISVVRRFPRARLWLLGEGSFGPDLWQMIKDRELTDTVILPGSFDDLTDPLRAADLFVLPAHDGGVRRPLLDAMAGAVPVLASDIPSHRWALKHGRDGWLVPPGNAGELARAIDRLLSDPTTCRQYGRAAQKCAAERFSLDAMADAHLALLKNLRERKLRTSS